MVPDLHTTEFILWLDMVMEPIGEHKEANKRTQASGSSNQDGVPQREEGDERPKRPEPEPKIRQGHGVILALTEQPPSCPPEEC